MEAKGANFHGCRRATQDFPEVNSQHVGGEKKMSVFDALSLLTPYDVDIPKIRIGPKTDGGYVLLDRFEVGQPVLSYGISTEFQFDIEMAERGHCVYMFDHTIDESSSCPMTKCSSFVRAS